MNKFVDTFATKQLVPPWKSEGSTCWCFAVPMAKLTVQRYLDKYFNGTYPAKEAATGSPYRFETLPSAQFGLVVVCRQPKICTEAGLDALAHDEVYLVIPVCRRGEAGNDECIVWVQPFVFGNNSTVLFSTREIVGIDMTWADIRYEFDDPKKLHVDVDINGVQTFGPRANSEKLNALHIATGPESTKTLDDFAKADADLEGFLDIVAKNGFIYLPVPFIDESTKAAKASHGPQASELNTLKQFRDVYDLGAAVYRALVACESSHSEVSDPIYFDPAKVEIDFMWSASVAELVGLFGIQKPRAAGRGAHAQWSRRASLRVKLAYSFSSTVHFRVLDTLHVYGD